MILKAFLRYHMLAIVFACLGCTRAQKAPPGSTQEAPFDLIDTTAIRDAKAREAVEAIGKLLTPVKEYSATLDNGGLSLFSNMNPSQDKHYGRRPDKLRIERSMQEFKARYAIVCDGAWTLIKNEPDSVIYQLQPLTEKGEITAQGYLASMGNLFNLFAQYKLETLTLESETSEEWVFTGECNYAMMPWAMTRLFVDKKTGFPRRLETDRNQFLQARSFIAIGKEDVVALLDVKKITAEQDLADRLFETNAPKDGKSMEPAGPIDGTHATLYQLLQRVHAVKLREGMAKGRTLEPPAAPALEETKSGDTGRTDAGDGKTITNSIGMKLRPIAPGTFMMGSPQTEIGYDEMEGPVRKVTISKPFYIGVYEVTQGEWQKVMGSNPVATTTVDKVIGSQMAAAFGGGVAVVPVKGAEVPITEVSWEDAQEFCRKLSAMEKATYRLPTEAEWEYACRAGTKTAYPWGDEFDTAYGWIDINSGGKLHAVGQRKPNAWGIHDMNGNAWEWCSDWFARYEGTEATDPKGPARGGEGGPLTRVGRGGGFNDDAPRARSAHRTFWFRADVRNPFIGLRVVKEE